MKGKRWGRSFALPAVILALVALLQSDVAARQESTSDKPAAEAERWGPLKLLVGSWDGEIDGKLGKGKGVRRYELIQGGRFILSRHESVRLPQEKSPKGDQHQELGIFSFDGERKTIVHREFMSEGIVIRSPCEVDGMKVVCVSEAVESGPGIRARLTLEITDRYRFTEIYEIAWPGKPFEHYFTNRWTRSPGLDDRE